ncbi:flagellar protein FlaG [Candidatus Neomarinimicrobiota bacterium]
MIDTIQSVSIGDRSQVTQTEPLHTNQQPRAAVLPAESGQKGNAESSIKLGNLNEIIGELNQFAEEVAPTKIAFDVDEATGKDIIKVLNKETGEVIRQFPPEDLLTLAAKMQEISGLIFNREV